MQLIPIGSYNHYLVRTSLSLSYRRSDSLKAITQTRKGHGSNAADLCEAITRDDIAHHCAQEAVGLFTDTGTSCQSDAKAAANYFFGLLEDHRVDSLGHNVLRSRGVDYGPLCIECRKEELSDWE